MSAFKSILGVLMLAAIITMVTCRDIKSLLDLWDEQLTQRGRDCPSGFQSYGNSCYFFSTNTLGWWAAQSSCMQMDATLVEINSAAEENYLRSKTQSYNWIGLTDFAVKGRWSWTKAGKQADFTNWKAGEPNNANGIEDCGTYVGTQRGEWQDIPCSYHFRFICEKY